MPTALPGVEGTSRGLQGTSGSFGQLSPVPPFLGRKILCLPHPSSGLPASPPLPLSPEAAPPSPGTWSSLLWTMGGPWTRYKMQAVLQGWGGVGGRKRGGRSKMEGERGEERDCSGVSPSHIPDLSFDKKQREEVF